MGKGFGIFLMILGVVVFFYGATIIPQYPTLSDSTIQIIGGIVFLIGFLIVAFSSMKPPRYGN